MFIDPTQETTKMSEALEEYSKKLPNAELPLTYSDRIVMLNYRRIFKALWMVFDLEMQFLTKKYAIEIRQKEKAIEVQDTSTSKITLKPKMRKVKGKDLPMEFIDINIRGNIFPSYSNVKGIAIGGDMLWSADMPFDDAEQLRSDIPPREPEIQTDIGDIPTLRESFPAPVMESTAIHPRQSSMMRSLQISRPTSHVDPLEIELFRGDARPAETVQSKTPAEIHELEHISLVKEIEKIVSETSPPKKQQKSKNGMLKFVEKPLMNKEEYTKFLKYKTKNPVKFYTRWGDHLDKYFQECSEAELMESDMLQHDCGEHIIEHQDIMPIPVLPFHLRDTIVAPPPENIHDTSIPEFEFPPRMVEYHEAPAEEQPIDSLYGEHLRGDLDASARFATMSQTGRDLPLGHDTVEDNVPLPHPLDALDLERTDVNIQALLPGDQTAMGDSIQELGFPELTLHTPQSKFSSHLFQEEVELSLKNLCSEKENLAIKFTDLCGLSESRLVASRVFLCVLGLWGQNKIEIHQVSDRPDDIYITLIQPED